MEAHRCPLVAWWTGSAAHTWSTLERNDSIYEDFRVTTHTNMDNSEQTPRISIEEHNHVFIYSIKGWEDQ